MLRRVAIPLFLLMAIVAAALVVWLRELSQVPVATPDPTSEAAFKNWLADDISRTAEFRKLSAFLREHEVADVVPVWQLTRIDAFYTGRCDIEPFIVPPEELWPEIVPALERVRSYVVPAVGEVTVLSSYRSPELNVCARGASRSKRLEFAALDLATVDRKEGRELYRKLCRMHADAGDDSRMGLGAYFDLDDSEYGGGRFHIDAEGYRSWGRDYTRASSPCARLVQPAS